ncbi:hypothetical protein FRC15_000001 [Serendipita sp. 397]|nr:hypothetical protein FRC15_000001 [Serendipita sp. 397]KAG8804849.1 hypothetical protein FRC16_000103 [Serendipita sp. 398]
MYDLIGDIPGLMQLRKFWPPPNVENVKGGNIERRKCYLVTNSIGLPLSKCRSLSEFSTVMLEVCDVLKAMHERGVYHRDVSWHNVMLNKRNTSPSSAPWADESGHSKSESSTQNDDRNGNQGAFYPEHRTHADTVLQPKALVGDLDQSIRTGSTWKGRRNRTGTPMFISREFCGGSDLRYSNFVDLLENLEDYVDSTQDPRLFHIKWLEQRERVLRSNRSAKRDRQTLEYSRCHDFESVFWIIVWFLARAWPSEEPHEANGDDAYHKFVSDMLTHRIRSPQSDEPDETRGIWLGATPRRWTNVLHPSIKPLGPAVSLIGYYLSIDWRIWEGEMDKDHAYAVMRAVLKNELDRIRTQESDVKLTTKRRPAGPPLGSPTLERKTTTSASLIASVTSGDSTGNHDPKRDEEPPANTLDQRLHRAIETEPKEELRSGDVEYDTDIDESPEYVEELGSLTRQASKLSQDTVPKLITQDILDKFTSGGDNGPLDRWAKMSYEMRVAWIEDRDWFTWGDIKEEDKADE